MLWRGVLDFVLACWFVLVLAFLFRKRRPRAREMRRGRNWTTGLLLQALSIAIVGGMPRRPGTAIWPLPPAAGLALAAFAVALAAASVWIMIAAERTLGREFAYEPRLIEGHRLVKTGPYAVVRHPIFTGLYGIVLATALAWTSFAGLLLSTAVFAAGTALRIRSEERLLRDAFGAEFEAYARQVPAVLPWT